MRSGKAWSDTPPSCFGAQGEWDAWRESRDGPNSPCCDCTPGHRDKMHAQGRCDRPEVIFVVKLGETMGLSADDYGYTQALAAHPHTPSLESAVRQALPRSTGRTRQALMAWLQRGAQ